MLNVNTIFTSHASKPKPPFFFSFWLRHFVKHFEGEGLASLLLSCIKNYHSLLVSIIYFKHSTIKKKTYLVRGKKLQNRKSLFVDFSTQSKTKTSKTDIIEHTSIATKQTTKLNLCVHNEHTQFLGFPNLENPQKKQCSN